MSSRSSAQTTSATRTRRTSIPGFGTSFSSSGPRRTIQAGPHNVERGCDGGSASVERHLRRDQNRNWTAAHHAGTEMHARERLQSGIVEPIFGVEGSDHPGSRHGAVGLDDAFENDCPLDSLAQRGRWILRSYVADELGRAYAVADAI